MKTKHSFPQCTALWSVPGWRHQRGSVIILSLSDDEGGWERYWTCLRGHRRAARDAHETHARVRRASAGRKWCRSPAATPRSSPWPSVSPESSRCRTAADCDKHLSVNTGTRPIQSSAINMFIYCDIIFMTLYFPPQFIWMKCIIYMRKYLYIQLMLLFYCRSRD